MTAKKTIFLVAGEHSGDQLGAQLMAALKSKPGSNFTFAGVGGEAMAEQGLESLFPLADVAVMGPLAILARLPKIIARVYQTKRAILAADPDVLVILDSPEFTHPIAKRVRREQPNIPIVNYVSPSVWAWRSGRAAKMRAYVDHVLALLPFEPSAHRKLGGPVCSYVGHPLVERLDWIKSQDAGGLADRLGLVKGRPVAVVLPGSRRTEIGLLMEPYGKALGLLIDKIGPIEVIVPVIGNLRPMIEQASRNWPVKPHFVEGESDKYQAYRLAQAALAASGTATLELALAGTPMVVAYRIERISAIAIRHMIKAQSIVLPNLILEKNAFPEFIQEDCTPANLALALEPLIAGGKERQAQLSALAQLEDRMRLDSGSPSDKAAGIVLKHMR